MNELVNEDELEAYTLKTEEAEEERGECGRKGGGKYRKNGGKNKQAEINQSFGKNGICLPKHFLVSQNLGQGRC